MRFVLLVISPLIALVVCIGCTRHRTLFGLAAVAVGLWLLLGAFMAHEITSRQASQTTNGDEGLGVIVLAVPRGAARSHEPRSPRGRSDPAGAGRCAGGASGACGCRPVARPA